MRRALAYHFFLIIILTFHLQAEDIDLIKINQVPHPRILLLKGQENAIKKAIGNDSTWHKMHDAIMAASDEMLVFPVLQRILEGTRLLDVSRECLRRVFYLSYAYRMTSEEKYLRRAEQEMLAVSNFSDWQPPHFLGVAEMSLGVAIGYDWLYDQLSPSSRLIIENALITKGIAPSFAYKDGEDPIYLRNNNWNQVCNAGMAYAALAVSESIPELSKKVLERSIKSIQLPMKAYGPDGNYTEGYMYWQYGTVFNILLLDAFEKVGIKAVNPIDFHGFMKTSSYLLNMTGTSGLSYNYMDCIPNSILNPAQFWFANQLKETSLLWVEKSYLLGDGFVSLTDGNGIPIDFKENKGNKFSKFTTDRTLPTIMIWGHNFRMEKVSPPKSLNWLGQGQTPVCMIRSSWVDDNAIYVGFKAGSAGTSHGHMDIGSFVLDADGVRWAADFGMQSYHSLESKGIDLWNMKQNSTRWSVFRYNNFAHNTLSVNGKLQNINGRAKIDRSGFDPTFSYAISDLSDIYKGQLKAVKRGIAIIKKKYVLVQDEFEGSSKNDTIRWTVMTESDVTLKGDSSIILRKDGKELKLTFNSSNKLKLKQWSAQSSNDFDEVNEGKSLFGYEVVLPANTKLSVSVKFIPGSSKGVKTLSDRFLDQWK